MKSMDSIFLCDEKLYTKKSIDSFFPHYCSSTSQYTKKKHNISCRLTENNRVDFEMYEIFGAVKFKPILPNPIDKRFHNYFRA